MIRKAETDHVEGVADRIRGAGAAGRNQMTRPAQIEIHRDFAGNGSRRGA